MTTVTVAEAREKLPELLQRVAAGEQIVITESGIPRAALGAAPAPAYSLSPVEEEAVVARREQLIREWLRLRSDAPLPIPEGMSHEAYFEQYQESE